MSQNVAKHSGKTRTLLRPGGCGTQLPGCESTNTQLPRCKPTNTQPPRHTRKHAAFDSISRRVYHRHPDLSDRGVGRVRIDHPATARDAKISPDAIILSRDVDDREIGGESVFVAENTGDAAGIFRAEFPVAADRGV